jgi:hypothetical protein
MASFKEVSSNIVQHPINNLVTHYYYYFYLCRLPNLLNLVTLT